MGNLIKDGSSNERISQESDSVNTLAQNPSKRKNANHDKFEAFA